MKSVLNKVNVLFFPVYTYCRSKYNLCFVNEGLHEKCSPVSLRTPVLNTKLCTQSFMVDKKQFWPNPIRCWKVPLSLDDARGVIGIPVLQWSPTHDFSCTVCLAQATAAFKHLSYEVTGWMLATDMFSLGRHQMGKHYNPAAIST